jgi:hypothetical protein
MSSYITYINDASEKIPVSFVKSKDGSIRLSTNISQQFEQQNPHTMLSDQTQSTNVLERSQTPLKGQSISNDSAQIISLDRSSSQASLRRQSIYNEDVPINTLERSFSQTPLRRQSISNDNVPSSTFERSFSQTPLRRKSISNDSVQIISFDRSIYNEKFPAISLEKSSLSLKNHQIQRPITLLEQNSFFLAP